MLLSEKERTRTRFAQVCLAGKELHYSIIALKCQRRCIEKKLPKRPSYGIVQMRSSSATAATSGKEKRVIICEEDDAEPSVQQQQPQQSLPDIDATAAAAAREGRKRGRGKTTASQPSRKSAAAAAADAPPTLAKKVCIALKEDILSMSRDAAAGLLPSHTIFCMSEEGNLAYVVQMLRRECPELCKDRRKLLLEMLSMLPEEA